MTVFDLHVHTTRGSSDSGLRPDQLIEHALEVGLDGVCLTEHGGGWNGPEIERAFSGSGLVVIAAIEAATDAGHVLVYGMRSYLEGMHTISGLRRVADRAGAVLVSAHPFRNLFNSNPNGVNLLYPDTRCRPDTPREASTHPIFSIVDEVEVANGGTTDGENAFAMDVGRELGLKGTGGSDAHSPHGLGRCVTLFDGEVRNEADLLDALRARAFAPAVRSAAGGFEPLDGQQGR